MLGISISSLALSDTVAQALSGGLILAPSGPGLCDLETDLRYREALENADINLPDSGLAILLARIFGLGQLPRTSGLGFLEALIENPALREANATFWVMPNEEAQTRNIAWLKSKQIPVEEQNCFIAPLYPRIGPVIDSDLLAAII